MANDPPNPQGPHEIYRIRERFADATGLVEEIHNIAVEGQAPGRSIEDYATIADNLENQVLTLLAFMRRFRESISGA